MITEIWLNGYSLDLYDNTEIKHTFQVNDVADVDSRQASYSNTFKIPRTPRNVSLLGGLGIHSNSSNIPYQKSEALIKIYGFDFLTNAWLNIKSTDEEYSIYIYSGIIEFFKKFENKTIGGSLTLTEIDHTKTVSTVVASQSNDSLDYTYLFADYNGRTHRLSDSTVINIDFIIPSVRVSYLFEKIHEFAGYTFSGSFLNSEDYTNWWLSYPKANEDVSSTLYYTGFDNQGYSYNGSTTFPLTQNNGGIPGIKVDTSGTYLVIVTNSAAIDDAPGTNDNEYLDLDIFFTINNGSAVTIADVSLSAPNSFSQTTSYYLSLSENDIITFSASWLSNWTGNVGISVQVYKMQNVSFSEELKELKINDFLKDIYNFFGLTAVVDNVAKNVDYITNAERFKNAEVEDWSDYLVEKTNENYDFGSYAKQNFFRYKYNDDVETHSDFSFKIENENLDDEKTVFKSFTNSIENPLNGNETSFYLNSTNSENVKVFKIYEKEPKEGTNQVVYKPLSKRFFYLRQNKKNIPVLIGSDLENVNVNSASVKIGEFKNMTMDYFLGKYYPDFVKVVDKPKVYDLKLNIPFAKMLKVDLIKVYYFKQFQQYFFMNKISFSDNEVTAEAVMINDFTVN